jgi:hypothetical protein
VKKLQLQVIEDVTVLVTHAACRKCLPLLYTFPIGMAHVRCTAGLCLIIFTSKGEYSMQTWSTF